MALSEMLMGTNNNFLELTRSKNFFINDYLKLTHTGQSTGHCPIQQNACIVQLSTKYTRDDQSLLFPQTFTAAEPCLTCFMENRCCLFHGKSLAGRPGSVGRTSFKYRNILCMLIDVCSVDRYGGGSQLYGQTGGGSQVYGYTGEYPRSHYSRRRSDYDSNFQTLLEIYSPTET